ncbi:hypothetical protein E3P99_02482 [Wallemia hederae]|uniref:HIT-type domain-containing protein n=1 Tax=Wallemia hederae TaxID=1540922 RepID=A0A4T0FK24_9BASI|nr:hypothetical protein E3P99_02482 [Wallemia hederae]
MPQLPYKKQRLNKNKQQQADTTCQVCHAQPFKYQHPATGLYYCSLPCYRSIQAELELSKNAQASTSVVDPDKDNRGEQQQDTQRDTHDTANPTPSPSPPTPPLIPLHSIRWPEEPDEAIFADALSRNDPKPLRRSEVLSIATSRDIRNLFVQYPNLKQVLRKLDSIEIDGTRNREVILQRVLGYDENSLSGKNIHGLPSNLANLQEGDREALQALMECMNSAIEGAHQMT